MFCYNKVKNNLAILRFMGFVFGLFVFFIFLSSIAIFEKENKLTVSQHLQIKICIQRSLSFIPSIFCFSCWVLLRPWKFHFAHTTTKILYFKVCYLQYKSNFF